MDGKDDCHAFGNKKLPSVVTDKVDILFRRDFFWNGRHEPPGKLRVPLFFLCFGGVPYGIAVCKFLRCMGWEHDSFMADFVLTSHNDGDSTVGAWQVCILPDSGHRKSRILFQISCLSVPLVGSELFSFLTVCQFDKPEFTNVSYSFQTFQYMPVLIHQQIFHNIA